MEEILRFTETEPPTYFVQQMKKCPILRNMKETDPPAYLKFLNYIDSYIAQYKLLFLEYEYLKDIKDKTSLDEGFYLCKQGKLIGIPNAGQIVKAMIVKFESGNYIKFNKKTIKPKKEKKRKKR